MHTKYSLGPGCVIVGVYTPNKNQYFGCAQSDCFLFISLEGGPSVARMQWK